MDHFEHPVHYLDNEILVRENQCSGMITLMSEKNCSLVTDFAYYVCLGHGEHFQSCFAEEERGFGVYYVDVTARRNLVDYAQEDIRLKVLPYEHSNEYLDLRDVHLP